MGTNHKADDLADFSQDTRFLLLSALACVIGFAGAFVADALLWLIQVITNICFYGRFSAAAASPAGNHLGAWVPIVPIAGALIIGLMARYGSDKIRGHGIPEALEAILIGRSKMDIKVAILKPISSAISIGSGGPFGAEGPIIMTGGAVGSLIGQMFHLSSAERKTLLVAGACAGMSAVFCTPIAAVLLAVELLLFEWRPRSFIPVATASCVAFATRIHLLGHGPIFPVTPHDLPTATILLLALVVGVSGGLCAAALTALVYGCEDLFSKLPCHWMWWPAIGGLIVGIGGMFEPRVLGVGYDVIHDLLQGHLIGSACLGLMAIKAIIWAIALGSGTSGGVLAPLLMIGGSLGALESSILPVGDPGMWAMLAMAATMGGTMRSPLTAIIFAVELTHDFNLLPALLLATTAAQAVTVLLMKRSILTEKVARRGIHISREYSIDPLQLVRVNEVMDSHFVPVPETVLLKDMADAIAHNSTQYGTRHAMPVVNATDELVGIITRGDVIRAVERDSAEQPLTIGDVATRNLITVYPDELVVEAMEKLLLNDIGRLLVVDRGNVRKLVGYIGRADVLRARMKQIQEEAVRERVWDGFKPAKPSKIKHSSL